MGLRSKLIEYSLAAAKKVSNFFFEKPDQIRSILILRNNGLGDLLCTTPLFEMIRYQYPEVKIYVGIGDWHDNLLDMNPYIDGVIRTNAPWHNQFVDKNSIFHILYYIFFSSEIKQLKNSRFDLGIDVLGSQWGTLLFIMSKIPIRFGVKGYAGGYKGTNRYIEFNSETHVTEASLKMGELLGIENKPSLKPQIYLTRKEIINGEKYWGLEKEYVRLAIAPGGSFKEKCWPANNFKRLLEKINKEKAKLILLGDANDVNLGERIEEGNDRVINLISKTTLRETCAIIKSCDLLVSNSSFLMHVAGAFKIPNIVLLGEWYDSSRLHKKQWGHEKSIILGKESSEGKTRLSSVNDTFILIKKINTKLY